MKKEMTILLAGADEALARRIRDACGRRPDLKIVWNCGDGAEARSILLAHRPDIALLCPGLDPREIRDLMSRALEARLPTACVLISDRRSEAFGAFQLNAADMLPPACGPERLLRALGRAALLAGSLGEPRKTVFIRTFGYFDVFVGGVPLYFSNAKAKELLAVLVEEEGGTVSMDTIVDRLWPDRPYDENVKQLYRKAVSYLKKLMETEGLDFFRAGRGWCAIHRTRVNCDLYDVLENKPHALDSWQGRYMFAYSWGEERAARLDVMKETYFAGDPHQQ